MGEATPSAMRNDWLDALLRFGTFGGLIIAVLFSLVRQRVPDNPLPALPGCLPTAVFAMESACLDLNGDGVRHCVEYVGRVFDCGDGQTFISCDRVIYVLRDYDCGC